MRSMFRRVLVAVVAVLAVGVVGVSSASAALPEFVAGGPITSEKPVKFTFKGGETKIVEEGSELFTTRCNGPTTGEGTITGPKALTAKLKFTGCTEGGVQCTSAGAFSEEVVTAELKSTLAYISKKSKEVGIVFNSEGVSPIFTTFACPGGGQMGVQVGVIAKITPVNTKSKSLAVNFSRVGKVNSPSQYENEKSEKVTRTLKGDLQGTYPNHLLNAALENNSEMEKFMQGGKAIELEVKA